VLFIPRITKPEFTKDVPIKVIETNDETGYVKSYGSVFGVVDEVGEVVDAGAFVKAIGRRKIRRVWQHDHKMPVGKLISITEDNKGLLLETQYNLRTSWGKDAYYAVKHGDVDSFSIGYNEVKEKNYTDDDGVKHLGEVDLREISDVTYPANEYATTVEVKSNDVHHGEPSLEEPDETKAGRMLSNVNAQDITALRANLSTAIEYCDAVLGRAVPPKEEAAPAAATPKAPAVAAKPAKHVETNDLLINKLKQLTKEITI